VNHFQINNNNLTGIIPSEICDMGSIFITENNFCPPYPECLSEEDIGYQDTSECPVFGCTDPEAFNYGCHEGEIPPGGTGCGNDITIDDGSCTYYPDEFHYNQSQLQGFYIIEDIEIDLEILCDWIGVFNDGLCVGSFPWVGDPTTVPTMGNDGFLTEGYLDFGDLPSFKIYDCSEDEYIDVEVSITDINGNEYNGWVNLGFFIIEEMIIAEDCADVEGCYIYSRELDAGANLISFWALPENTSITNVMSSLGNNVTDVIGEGVAATQTSLTWSGSLTNISYTSGYWVIVDNASTLTLEGYLNENTVYSLHAGANLISYPFPATMGITESIPDITEGYFTDIIGGGVATTQTSPFTWAGSLDEFDGGNGYWVIVTFPFEFSFTNPDGLIILSPETPKNNFRK